jgi:hypothetical protein
VLKAPHYVLKAPRYVPEAMRCVVMRALLLQR